MNPRSFPILALALSLGFVAGAAPAAAGASPVRPKPVAPEVPIFDGDAIGVKQVVDYQKVAQDSGRRLLLVFGTNDCAPCRAFNKAIHQKQFFSAFINQFVPVYIDVSSGTNASLLVDYNINPAAPQPGIVILMPDARITDVLAQGEMATLAKKGDAAVQEFFLARFAKSEK